MATWEVAILFTIIIMGMILPEVHGCALAIRYAPPSVALLRPRHMQTDAYVNSVLRLCSLPCANLSPVSSHDNATLLGLLRFKGLLWFLYYVLFYLSPISHKY